MNLLLCKAYVEHFSFNNLHQDFDMRTVQAARDACQHFTWYQSPDEGY